MKKLSDKKKAVIFLLHEDDDLNFSQKKIAALMDVSQSTVSYALKEMRYRVEIENMKKELKNAQKYIEQKLGFEVDAEQYYLA